MHFYNPVRDLLKHMRNANDSSLIGDCFLERGNSLIFLGAPGAGKSKSAQALCGSLATGTAFVDMKPARALRVLYVQAEDTIDDLAESFQGFVKHTLDGDKDSIELLEKNLTIVTVVGHSGPEFLEWLEKACERHKPDVVVVDPLLAFIGCDLVDQKSVTRFLRGLLHPILIKHNCGFIGVHHKRKGEEGSELDQGLGSTEFSAFFRGAISLSVSKARHQELTMKVVKRQRQLGWTDADGNPTDTKYLLKGQDGVYFTEVSGFEPSSVKLGGRPRKNSEADIVNFIRGERAKGASEDALVESVAKKFSYSAKQAKRYVSATPAEIQDASREVQTEFPF